MEESVGVNEDGLVNEESPSKALREERAEELAVARLAGIAAGDISEACGTEGWLVDVEPIIEKADSKAQRAGPGANEAVDWEDVEGKETLAGRESNSVALS